jgi:uncharacterized protein (DUF302 family)
VKRAVNTRIGPSGLVALARLEQGVLLSLNGEALRASLYLVGNPLVAREVMADDPAGALYAPFRVAVFGDDFGLTSPTASHRQSSRRWARGRSTRSP